MTFTLGLDADLARLNDLLCRRTLASMPDRERIMLAELQVRLIRARLTEGLYAVEPTPEPLPARGREIAASPWN
ncbi:MAG: hypothetical protein ABI353_04425 [Isosphaeraceae bacterium]